MVRDDLTGICKFANLDYERLVSAIELLTGIKTTETEIRTAVRNAFIRGLWLERKQGFTDSDYVLPEQVYKNPNPNIGTENFINAEYLAELKEKVFQHFDKEVEKLCA